MGWWRIENGHDLVIGDSVVDSLTLALRDLAEARRARGDAPPTLPALLAAIADALRRKTAMWCGPEEDTPFAGLRARVEHDDDNDGVDMVEVVDEDVIQDPVRDPEVADRMLEAFEDIALIYEDEAERRPRRRELLAVVEFTLSDAPDEFLAIAEGTRVLALNVVAPGSAAPGTASAR